MAALGEFPIHWLQVKGLVVTLKALLTYDTLLTFGDEVNFIWTRTADLGSAMYLLARYSCITSTVLCAMFDIFNYQGTSTLMVRSTHYRYSLSIKYLTDSPSKQDLRS
jgi:hypothetical protein